MPYSAVDELVLLPLRSPDEVAPVAVAFREEDVRVDLALVDPAIVEPFGAIVPTYTATVAVGCPFAFVSVLDSTIVVAAAAEVCAASEVVAGSSLVVCKGVSELALLTEATVSLVIGAAVDVVDAGAGAASEVGAAWLVACSEVGAASVACCSVVVDVAIVN